MSANECDCPIDMYGTRTHPADCPTVAFIQETKKQLSSKLAEMDRVRRKGAAEARNYVIY